MYPRKSRQSESKRGRERDIQIFHFEIEWLFLILRKSHNLNKSVRQLNTTCLEMNERWKKKKKKIWRQVVDFLPMQGRQVGKKKS